MSAEAVGAVPPNGLRKWTRPCSIWWGTSFDPHFYRAVGPRFVSALCTFPPGQRRHSRMLSCPRLPCSAHFRVSADRRRVMATVSCTHEYHGCVGAWMHWCEHGHMGQTEAVRTHYAGATADLRQAGIALCTGSQQAALTVRGRIHPIVHWFRRLPLSQTAQHLQWR